MSSFEKLCHKLLFRGKSQYDYEKISFNQCSWFAYCVLDELKGRKWSVPENMDEMKKLRSDSLIRASDLRKKYFKYSWGESIYSKDIIKMCHHNIELPIISVFNKEKEFEDLKVHEDIMSYIPAMKGYIEYKKNIPRVDFSKFKDVVNGLHQENSYILLNRYGESFLIYPVREKTLLKDLKLEKNEKIYYVFDSHTRDFGVFKLENLMKYIVGNQNACCVVIWMKGYSDDNVSYRDVKEIEKIFY